jgi:hypothetical protein
MEAGAHGITLVGTVEPDTRNSTLTFDQDILVRVVGHRLPTFSRGRREFSHRRWSVQYCHDLHPSEVSLPALDDKADLLNSGDAAAIPMLLSRD